MSYWTPAHHAVEHFEAADLARLLAGGADPDEVFGDMTLLTHALDSEGDAGHQGDRVPDVHMTAILLAFGADPALPDPAGRTPLDMARFYRHEQAIELLTRHVERR